MKNMFTAHPRSLGESYFQHLRYAILFGSKMIIGGFACIIHAILPFLFEKTGSNMLLSMTHNFIDRMPKVETRVIKLSHLINEKSHAPARARKSVVK